MNKYKYDVAFSLCQQDYEYAVSLYTSLNLHVKSNSFLYNTAEQEKIITEIGPEVYGKTYKENSRVVVVLYRKEYGNSYYTTIEKNAIIDRTGKANEGFDFIFMLPMEPEERPSWYPENRIYVDPRHFSPDQISKFIEFKVADRGGEIKPITFIDSINDFELKIDRRDKLIKHLINVESKKYWNEELKKLISLFNEKKIFLETNRTAFNIYCHPGTEQHPEFAIISNNEIFFKISVDDYDDLRYDSKACAIAYRLNMKVLMYKYDIQMQKQEVILEEKHYRINVQNDNLVGWSEEIIMDLPQEFNHHGTLFNDYWNNRYYYDLKDFYSIKDLVEIWAVKLFKYTNELFEESKKMKQ